MFFFLPVGKGIMGEKGRCAARVQRVQKVQKVQRVVVSPLCGDEYEDSVTGLPSRLPLSS